MVKKKKCNVQIVHVKKGAKYKRKADIWSLNCNKICIWGLTENIVKDKSSLCKFSCIFLSWLTTQKVFIIAILCLNDVTSRLVTKFWWVSFSRRVCLYVFVHRNLIERR